MTDTGRRGTHPTSIKHLLTPLAPLETVAAPDKVEKQPNNFESKRYVLGRLLLDAQIVEPILELFEDFSLRRQTAGLVYVNSERLKVFASNGGVTNYRGVGNTVARKARREIFAQATPALGTSLASEKMNLVGRPRIFTRGFQGSGARNYELGLPLITETERRAPQDLLLERSECSRILLRDKQQDQGSEMLISLGKFTINPTEVGALRDRLRIYDANLSVEVALGEFAVYQATLDTKQS